MASNRSRQHRRLIVGDEAPEVALDPGEMGDGSDRQPAAAGGGQAGMPNPAIVAVDAALDEPGVGQPLDQPRARRGADQQALGEHSHRGVAADLMELDEHVVPRQRQTVALDQLIVEAIDERDVGTQESSPRRQRLRAGAIAARHAVRVVPNAPGHARSVRSTEVESGRRIDAQRRRRLLSW